MVAVTPRCDQKTSPPHNLIDPFIHYPSCGFFCHCATGLPAPPPPHRRHTPLRLGSLFSVFICLLALGTSLSGERDATAWVFSDCVGHPSRPPHPKVASLAPLPLSPSFQLCMCLPSRPPLAPRCARRRRPPPPPPSPRTHPHPPQFVFFPFPCQPNTPLLSCSSLSISCGGGGDSGRSCVWSSRPRMSVLWLFSLLLRIPSFFLSPFAASVSRRVTPQGQHGVQMVCCPLHR